MKSNCSRLKIMTWLKGGVISATLLSSSPLLAATQNENNFGVSGGFGSLGMGVQSFYRVNDYFSVRASANRLSFNQEVTQEDLDLDVTVEGTSYGAGIDYYPFRGSFRIFGGYMNYGNEIEIEAIPENGILEINGEEYDTSTELKRVYGKITTPKDAGYVGFGWGNPTYPGKALGFMLDFGIVLLSESRVDLNAECYENSVICHGVQTNIEEEEYDLQNTVSGTYKAWPYINMSLSYAF